MVETIEWRIICKICGTEVKPDKLIQHITENHTPLEYFDLLPKIEWKG